tara:strand:- start:1837 stop:1998 length:162 start_codon:yes stop_codon:yes gene_type:complete
MLAKAAGITKTTIRITIGIKGYLRTTEIPEDRLKFLLIALSLILATHFHNKPF